MPKILFVCMGNICRSPAAEAMFAHCVENEGLKGKIEVDSAGTIREHAGQKADRRMIRAAASRGIEIVSRARQIVREDLDAFDLVIVMDRFNQEAVLALAASDGHREKVVLMCDYHPDPDVTEVPDPYYGGSEGFEHVLDLLETACRNLLKDVVKRFGLK